MAAYGAARGYVENLLGGPVNEQDGEVATGAAAVVAALNDPDRCVLVFVNLGANTIFVALDPTVSATDGIQLNANGGSVSMNVTQDFTLPSRQWSAISPAGASTLFVLQVRRIALNPS